MRCQRCQPIGKQFGHVHRYARPWLCRMAPKSIPWRLGHGDVRLLPVSVFQPSEALLPQAKRWTAGSLRCRNSHEACNHQVFYLMERAYGGFQRTVRLPTDVDPDSAKAMLRNGVLKVELKKRRGEGARRRLIEVR
jgi:hypothetical protein